MKKYFLYELKRYWLALLIITVFSALIYLMYVLPADFTQREWGTPRSYIDIPLIALVLLCTVVPVLMFSFKTDAKQADCLYSLPIKRQKIYFVKAVIGLMLVIIPYTIAFWSGFTVTALKPNSFTLSRFVAVYFISVPLAVMLFGINSFAFTRATRIIDGIIFIALYAGILAMPVALIQVFTNFYGYRQTPFDALLWFSYSPLIQMIMSQEAYWAHHSFTWVMYVVAGVTGTAAWIGLFLTAQYEKAENAERLSNTKIGYIILIPYYFTFMTTFSGLFGGMGMAARMIIIIVGLIFSISLYIIFRRSFKLKKEDWISIGGALIIGIILSVILYFAIRQ